MSFPSVSLTITWGRWSYSRTINGAAALGLGLLLIALGGAC
jgi:hypothetical protein